MEEAKQEQHCDHNKTTRDRYYYRRDAPDPHLFVPAVVVVRSDGPDRSLFRALFVLCFVYACHIVHGAVLPMNAFTWTELGTALCSQ